MELLKKVSETYLLKISAVHRALILVLLVSILSLVFEGSAKIDWFLSERNNPLNLYLVKWGWAWTFSLVGIFMFTLSYVLHGRIFSLYNLQNIGYLAAGTLVWYAFAVQIFPYIEDKTGVCQATQYTNKRECSRAGFWWVGFDCSGHCFLLLWNVLFIVEETRVLNSVKTVYRTEERRSSTLLGGPGGDIPPLGTASGSTIERIRAPSPSSRLPEMETELETISARVKKWFYVLEAQFFLLSLLTLVWELMIISTAVHFHTTAEKMAGTFCALLSWLIVYRMFGYMEWRKVELRNTVVKKQS